MNWMLFCLLILYISIPIKMLTNITSCDQLKNLTNMTEEYQLTTNIDCSSQPNFIPIGSNTNQFFRLIFMK